MIKLRPIAYRLALLCVSALGMTLHAGSAAPTAQINPPVPVPDGDSGFVGTTKADFKKIDNGRIAYTLDGTAPTALHGSTYIEGESIPIDHTLILRAVHVRALAFSEEVQVRFIRAKLPIPIAKYLAAPNYGALTNFYPKIDCALSVEKPGIVPVIHYTTDGSAPTGVASATNFLYAGTLTLTRSTVLKAIASYAGYDDSDPMQVNFTLLAPAVAPTVDPPGKSFAAKTMVVKLKTVTDGAVVRYSIDTTAKLDTCAIALGDSVTIQGNKINVPIVLRAQAFKKDNPPSAVITEKYTYLPQVATPVPTWTPGFFNDTLFLRFTSTTPGAVIRYNHGTTLPTATTGDTASVIALSTTETISAIAFKSPQPQSNYFSGVYNLALTSPVPDKGPRAFQDSLNVFLSSPCPGALIYYTLNGDVPTIGSSLYNTAPPQKPITISRDGTILTVIAVKGSVVSPAKAYLYTKSAGNVKLADPSITPTGRQFRDSILITLGNNDTAAAEIRYTVDGTLPTATSKLYLKEFFIDSTATVRAQAFPIGGTALASGFREEKYTLLPSPPTSSPAAAQSFPDSVLVTLNTSTRHGVIFFSLGGQILDLKFMHVYTAKEIIPIRESTRLQAITVMFTGTDTVKSLPLTQDYEIYASPPTDTMAVGASRKLAGEFNYTNNSANPIVAKVVATNGMGITGFREAGTVVQIQPVQPGKPVKVTFTKVLNVSNSLYRVSNGIITWITSDTPVDVTAAGNYFAGIDTLPPTISILSQTPKTGDSTTVRISIKDNVAAPNCEIQSEGLPGGLLSRRPDSTGLISAAFKNSGTAPKSLWLRVKAADFYNVASLPRDPLGKSYLTQTFSNISTPSVLDIGKDAYPWDLAGFPISSKAPITWGQVRKDNPDVNLYAMVLKNDADYLPLEDDSLIRPGMSFWLASNKALRALSLSRIRTGESDSNGAYRVTLHHGWNQVSSPALEKLYWPFSRKDPKYGQYTIKGLNEFMPGLFDYADSDTLSTWKGYFAYSYGDKDTTLSLYADSVRHGLGKISAFSVGTAAAANEGLQISLDFGRPIPLTLGADTRADDGFSSEDELQLPAWKPDFAAWSQRGRRKLTTDMLRFEPQSVFRWDVVVRDSSLAHGHARGTEGMRVLPGRMPVGYQAWAVSRARGMKFRMDEGASLSMAGQAGDTLTVFAGPVTMLSQVPELAKAVVVVEAFAFALKKDAAGGYIVNLSLPWNCRVDISLVSVSGRLLYESHPGDLAQGVYSLPLGIRKNPQLGILRVRLHGENVDRQVTQKLLW